MMFIPIKSQDGNVSFFFLENDEHSDTLNISEKGQLAHLKTETIIFYCLQYQSLP